MIANDLHDQLPVPVRGVDQIQNVFVIRIERDVQIAIRGSVCGDDAPLDRGARFEDRQPLLLVDMRP